MISSLAQTVSVGDVASNALFLAVGSGSILGNHLGVLTISCDGC